MDTGTIEDIWKSMERYTVMWKRGDPPIAGPGNPGLGRSSPSHPVRNESPEVARCPNRRNQPDPSGSHDPTGARGTNASRGGHDLRARKPFHEPTRIPDVRGDRPPCAARHDQLALVASDRLVELTLRPRHPAFLPVSPGPCLPEARPVWATQTRSGDPDRTVLRSGGFGFG